MPFTIRGRKMNDFQAEINAFIKKTLARMPANPEPEKQKQVFDAVDNFLMTGELPDGFDNGKS